MKQGTKKKQEFSLNWLKASKQKIGRIANRNKNKT